MPNEFQKLQSVFDAHDKLTTGMATLNDVQEATVLFLGVVKELKSTLEKSISDKYELSLNSYESVSYDIKDLELRLEKLITEAKQASMSDIKSLASRLNSDIERVRSLIPTLPDLSYLERKISDLEKKIPVLPPPVILDNAQQIKDKVNTLYEEIEPKVIKGWNDLQNKLKNNTHNDFDVRIGISKTEFKRLVDRVIALESGSTVSGVSSIIAGTNISISPAGGTGAVTINSTASGSSSGYQAATGTVDGSNTSFTFATAPNVIQVDGVQMQKTSSDGTVNWTGTTSVTLTIAPSWDIFSPA